MWSIMVALPTIQADFSVSRADASLPFTMVMFGFAGGGVLIPVRKGLRPILIDVGARFQGNGEARYLKDGSIEDNSDGTISFTPIRSETNLVTYHLGVSFGF